jgi:hypothetical protein
MSRHGTRFLFNFGLFEPACVNNLVQSAAINGERADCSAKLWRNWSYGQGTISIENGEPSYQLVKPAQMLNLTSVRIDEENRGQTAKGDTKKYKGTSMSTLSTAQYFSIKKS